MNQNGRVLPGALLTVFEVSSRTGWKPSTVRKKILRREIGYVKLGRSVRIPESELLRLFEEGYRPAISNLPSTQKMNNSRSLTTIE